MITSVVPFAVLPGSISPTFHQCSVTKTIAQGPAAGIAGAKFNPLKSVIEVVDSMGQRVSGYLWGQFPHSTMGTVSTF